MEDILAQHFIFMGVCGSGKSTIGNMLAESLDLVFFDADDFHSAESVRKMHEGKALDDEDRKPWLSRLHHHLTTLTEKRISSVLACSCLKQAYRMVLSEVPRAHIHFMFLQVDFKQAKKRLRTRRNHYMNPKLLQSQFDALEIPAESGTINVSVINANSKNIEAIVEECEKILRT